MMHIIVKPCYFITLILCSSGQSNWLLQQWINEKSLSLGAYDTSHVNSCTKDSHPTHLLMHELMYWSPHSVIEKLYSTIQQLMSWCAKLFTLQMLILYMLLLMNFSLVECIEPQNVQNSISVGQCYFNLLQLKS